MFLNPVISLNSQVSKISHRSKQTGSALVIGVFIITVMFLLAATLINVLDDADQEISIEVWGTRAFAAANSGADRALATLFPVDGSAGSCSNPPLWEIGNDTSLVGFHGCEVLMTCSATTTNSSQNNMTQYLITSTATCSSGQCNSGSDSDASCIRVSRKVEVEARD
ncbi:MSHA biogenesis protein MshP [Shewanella sp. c952]|uniref:MSHA biogenesis protein MshP n=1 Tax=Shewanella sp. c952 TaxID=2815913 RepID=UPI001BC608FF|nr:MSHA biogenesis protein MshP [Shewanella sp. c952]GIU08189.1 MSHA biogenesis protein MshP [Shewanella sp. c952]